LDQGYLPSVLPAYAKQLKRYCSYKYDDVNANDHAAHWASKNQHARLQTVWLMSRERVLLGGKWMLLSF